MFYLLKSNKNNHRKIIKQLEITISKLLDEQKQQSVTLKLSDELQHKLYKSRSTIDERIMDLQHDLFSLTTNKN
jgi:ABC-type phosphate transport system auxiliary subunit